MCIVNIYSKESIAKIVALNKNCTVIDDKIGWRCKDICMPLEWVCDNDRNQCPLDQSDEDEGCHLFPGKIIINF